MRSCAGWWTGCQAGVLTRSERTRSRCCASSVRNAAAGCARPSVSASSSSTRRCGRQSPVRSKSCSVRDACLRRAFGWLVWASRGLEPPHSLADVKRLCEFALVADLLQRRRRKLLGRLVSPTFARRLLTSCWSALGCGEILRTYVEGDRSGGLFVTAYPPFFRNGLRNAGLERALRRVLRTTEYRPVDFAILVGGAQRLLQGALGRPRAGYDRWPARWTRPCPTTREVYLLAHAVFYERTLAERRIGSVARTGVH